MLTSRKLYVEFAATFLIGALAGGLIVSDLTDTKLSGFMKRASDPESMATRVSEKYAHDYQLTPDQQKRVDPLTTQMTQKLYQVRRQFGLDVIAILDDYHRKVGEQLTPAQRTIYDKANEDRKQRLSAMLLPEQSLPAQGQN